MPMLAKGDAIIHYIGILHAKFGQNLYGGYPVNAAEKKKKNKKEQTDKFENLDPSFTLKVCRGFKNNTIVQAPFIYCRGEIVKIR